MVHPFWAIVVKGSTVDKTSLLMTGCGDSGAIALTDILLGPVCRVNFLDIDNNL